MAAMSGKAWKNAALLVAAATATFLLLRSPAPALQPRHETVPAQHEPVAATAGAVHPTRPRAVPPAMARSTAGLLVQDEQGRALAPLPGTGVTTLVWKQGFAPLVLQDDVRERAQGHLVPVTLTRGPFALTGTAHVFEAEGIPACACSRRANPSRIPHPRSRTTSRRSRTGTVRSWCQATSQFAAGDLSNNVARTQEQPHPSAGSTKARNVALRARSRTAGRTRPRRSPAAPPACSAANLDASRWRCASPTTTSVVANPSRSMAPHPTT
jgi:hypothetical protein